ncbi:hypothetical protein Pcinc_027425 [Petrolisthes cinctipes]|uniref:Uncharacterized protein n=1 Tax=Petrolisthes cinctipes TaxID=88211 RepID=A0AAE1F4E0_PETCI|nr:hypothetical protein Pcinc_027425 [Petrolisthes cinctipes]
MTDSTIFYIRLPVQALTKSDKMARNIKNFAILPTKVTRMTLTMALTVKDKRNMIVKTTMKNTLNLNSISGDKSFPVTNVQAIILPRQNPFTTLAITYKCIIPTMKPSISPINPLAKIPCTFPIDVQIKTNGLKMRRNKNPRRVKPMAIKTWSARPRKSSRGTIEIGVLTCLNPPPTVFLAINLTPP